MKIGSLFSGIGGLEMGLEWSGIGETVWQVERDPYCLQILDRHWPRAKRLDDVCAVGRINLEPVDLICGGFPCQDVSSAGKGAGLAGSRSGLWGEFARVVSEMRPRWVVVENVLSGASRWFDPVVRDLEKLGYECLPLPISAADVGAPHLRKRLFITARFPDSIQLRDQQGRTVGESRQRSTVARHYGAKWIVPDTNGERREEMSTAVGNSDCLRKLQSERLLGDIGGRAGNTDWWATEPDVGRVAHGVPARAHRLRALGNAVVPQCAEVAGWAIRELESRFLELRHG